MFHISNLDIQLVYLMKKNSREIVVKLEFFQASYMTSLFKRLTEPIHSNQSTCRPE